MPAVAGVAFGLAVVPASQARPDIVPGGAFDRSLDLAQNGRSVEASGPHGCAEGESWRIDVVITQGDAIAEGHTQGLCLGSVGTWRALAVARGDLLLAAEGSERRDSASGRLRPGGTDAR